MVPSAPKACPSAGREDTLARDNYSYKKYAREQAKKKKKEEKLQRKLDKKNAKSAEEQGQLSGDNIEAKEVL
jgi:hypothetical protein